MPSPLRGHFSFHPDVFSGTVVLAWSKKPFDKPREHTCVSKNGRHVIKRVTVKDLTSVNSLTLRSKGARSLNR